MLSTIHRASGRRGAQLAAAISVALAFGCSRGADTGASPGPSPAAGATPEGHRGGQAAGGAALSEGAPKPSGFSPPTLGGSAALGDAGGLAILNPTDLERPFFRDFGGIPRGETRTWTIRMQNQDAAPVQIKDARGACGCMHVRFLRARLANDEVIEGDPYAKEPPLLTVPAGALLEIELELSTEKVQPNQDKLAVFRVTTDSAASPFITFEAHLLALTSFVATPAELAFGDVPQGFGGRKKVRILAEPVGSPARILGIAEQGKRVHAELEETFYGGEFVWHVMGDVPALEPLGAIRDRIVLKTTDEHGEGDAGRMTIDVMATVVRDIRISPSLFAFGAQKAGTAAEAHGTLDALVPGARAKVIGAHFEGPSAPHLEAVYEPLQPDEGGRAVTTNVTVKLSAAHPTGPLQARLFLELDDPSNPVASAPVSGLVR
ncbi:MAG: DUF1573 domain-containing protein [Planctomycetota bacterium]